MRNRDVAALWARQARPRATGSNLSFHGPVLKSYSTAIAELVALPGGGQGVVLDLARYSSSTRRHQSYAECAVCRLPSVEIGGRLHYGKPTVVPDEGPRRTAWAREQIESSQEKAAEARAKARRARRPDTRAWHERRVAELKANAARLAAWFMAYDNEEPDSVRQDGRRADGEASGE